MMSRGRKLDDVFSAAMDDILTRKMPGMRAPKEPLAPILPVSLVPPGGTGAITPLNPAGAVRPSDGLRGGGEVQRQIPPMAPRPVLGSSMSPGLQQMRRRMLTTAFPRLY